MPPTNQYFLNPSAGFTPSQGLSATPNVTTGQTGAGGPISAGTFGANIGGGQAQPPIVRAGTFTTPQPPQQAQPQSQTYNAAAVRPTDQSGPQAAWMQNMATFAGGNLASSNALGNVQQGPVRRLVDVLGQQPFGEQNPMTLLMQALQQGNYGVQLPTTPNQPANPPIYRPPIYNNPGWGAPVRPTGFNPMQMGTL